MTQLGADRWSLELSTAASPDRVLADLVAAGGCVVSLNPLRETLEDFFVQRVTRPGNDARH
jgi:hypothetical protein